MKLEKVDEAKETLILSHLGTPSSAHGYFSLGAALANFTKYDEETLKVVIERLESEGFLKNIGKLNSKSNEGDYYKTTKAIVMKREQLLHDKNLRKSYLLIPKLEQLEDLIVAICVDVQVNNRRMPAGFLPADEVTSVTELIIYLHKFNESDVLASIENLKAKKLLEEKQVSCMGEQVPGYKLSILGVAHYKREVMSKFGLDLQTSILDLNKDDDALTIFWAWQSEYKTSRNQISNVLNEVCEHINSNWKPILPCKISVATEIGDGAIQISVELIKKIRNSELFVADFSPVLKFGNRLYPSSNVLIETGYALEGKDAHQVYAIESVRDLSDIPGDDSAHAAFPFDFYVLSRVKFTQPKELKSRLLAEFAAVLTKRGKLMNPPIM
jgi:hypothetical protein